MSALSKHEVPSAIVSINRCFELVGVEEDVSIDDSRGRITHRVVTSSMSIPPIPTSILDGFAIRLDTLKIGTTLVPAGTARAGECRKALRSSDCVMYVATGAYIPEGADIVVPIEQCEVSEESVKILPNVNILQIGQNIRQVGSDTVVGDVLVNQGVQIGASELALLTACKVQSVSCYSKVRISIVSTGLEIMSGQVGDTNRSYMLNRLGESDLVNTTLVSDLGIIEDDAEHFARIINSPDFDILVTTGSLSRGATDYFKSTLASSPNWNILFGQLDLKPGKPTTVAVSQDKKRIIFCLPGNPASCFVTFNLFVLPALYRMMGKKAYALQKLSVSSIEPIQEIFPDSERPEYLRAVVSLINGRVVARLVDGHQRSSRVASIVDTVGGDPVNALVIISPSPTSIITDKSFDVLLLHGRSLKVSTDTTLQAPSTSSVVFERAKAGAFDKLVDWLKVRNDVENIDLMDLAGFCRNCLSEWLAQSEVDLDINTAKNYVYGMDYDEWKKLYRKGDKKEHGPRVPTKSNPCASSIRPAVSISSCVLTVSDRAALGTYSDVSGPVTADFLRKNFQNSAVNEIVVIPDEKDAIQNQVHKWMNEDAPPTLIVTTGGTGHSVRDVTPESIIPLLIKRSSGLEHLLLSKFITKDPMHALTRPVIGLLGPRTMIVCLPGRPEAVSEALAILKDPLGKIFQDFSS